MSGGMRRGRNKEVRKHFMSEERKEIRDGAREGRQ